ncbi:MAG: carbohydrate-binding protein, partial [Phaeodactylibacter sp.]|nr:carbohydrate-binding protein [Phaeodactylibacter sp.]
GTYDGGTTIALTATPDAQYQFDSWSGDASGSSNPLSVLVDGNKSIVANFSLVQGGCQDVAYQAEDGSWSNAAVETEHSGYTGTGYVNTDNNAGEWVQVQANVASAGTYEVSIVYANGSSDRPVDVSVNGTFASNVSLPGTGGWTSWASADFTLTLGAGNNDIRLTATGSSGAPNIDRVDVCQGSAPPASYSLSTTINGQGSVSPSSGTYTDGTVVNLTATPASGWEFDSWGGVDNSSGNTASVTMNANRSVTVTFTEIPQNAELTIQEDSDGFCGVDGAVEIEHSGYTGTGYANSDNNSGAGVDYAVDLASSGSYTIEIRYAATSNRPADLLQDGSSVAGSIALNSTGAWDS